MDDDKLKLEISLAPPLPQRRFLLVCAQKTVKDLKNEIRRRLVTLIQEPIALISDGFELMDDDLVVDLLSNRDSLVVVLHQHLHSYYAQETPGQPADTTDTIDVSSASGIGSNSRSEKQVPQHQKQVSRPPVYISRKEHHAGSLQAQQTPNPNKRIYPAEIIYGESSPVQTNPSSIITDQSVSKDASMDSSNSSKGTETRTRRKRTDSISSSSSSDTTTSDSSSTSSSSTTTGSESTGNSSGANHAEEDATSCKICGESIRSHTEHICFEHGSVSSNDSPETMPLDRLSVSGTPSRRIASITIPEILQLEDASPSNARPGHLIAYKSLEIASNVTPVVSNYKVAEIIGADKTGLLSVRVLREFRHDKDTGSSVGSAARQRRADLLTSNQTDPNTEPGSNDDDLVVLDPSLIYNLKFIGV
ncbi:hypothetical protein EV177_006701 [Coemansia sp. RSA 1804]|nr:hypothetical protein EV177_006701 [Coemansia sp. RSA 1804]